MASTTTCAESMFSLKHPYCPLLNWVVLWNLACLSLQTQLYLGQMCKEFKIRGLPVILYEKLT